jgi:hypothetical protein
MISQARLEKWTEATNPYVQRVLKLWPDGEKSEIARAIIETARDHDIFTADDVRYEHPFLIRMRPNCISAMYSAVHKAGFIICVDGNGTSSRPLRHGGSHRRWRINNEVLGNGS